MLDFARTVPLNEMGDLTYSDLSNGPTQSEYFPKKSLYEDIARLPNIQEARKRI